MNVYDHLISILLGYSITKAHGKDMSFPSPFEFQRSRKTKTENGCRGRQSGRLQERQREMP